MRRSLSLALAAVAAAPLGAQQRAADELRAAFRDYWYSGVAELNRYEVQRARYGELRPSRMVLVYVTEDFRTDVQVKFEGREPNAPSTSVLKLNRTETFSTGIYDYSLMTSTFVPVDETVAPSALKVTTSVQEWCGHAWLQANRKDGRIDVTGHSYFEGEGEQQLRLRGTPWLEEELWVRVRFGGAAAMPTGAVQVVQDTVRQRLSHQEPAVARAQASVVDLDTETGEPERTRFTLRYESGRELVLDFERNFPWRIERFEEAVVRGERRAVLTTGTRTRTVQLDYWSKNSRRDEGLRPELDLPSVAPAAAKRK